MLGLKKSIIDLNIADIENKTIVIRVDYNVISEKTGQIDDDTRVTSTIPTLDYIKKFKPKSIVILSHCGRPKGVEAKLSLKPVAELLSKLLSTNVKFLNDCVGPAVQDAVKAGVNGQIFLCENVRFHAEECDSKPEDKVKAFKDELNKLGDLFVIDAFGTAHRAHSSMVCASGVKPLVGGLLLKRELDYFSVVMEKPDRPFLAILGGAKVCDKIKVIESLLDRVNTLLIGGGMAPTFLKVLNNMSIGNSLYDEEGSKNVDKIMKKAAEKNVQILLPLDFKITEKFCNDSPTKIVTREEGVPDGWMSLDIGPESIKQAERIISQSKLIIWNGPQGVFEMSNFAAGSEAVLNAMVEQTNKGVKTVVGGGDSAAMCAKYDCSDKMSHVSTGGGATLELLEGKCLPGIAALKLY